MEYMTIIVRWGDEPKPHVGLIPSDNCNVKNWYMTRWKGDTEEKGHLTVIFMKIATSDADTIFTSTMMIIKTLWSNKDSYDGLPKVRLDSILLKTDSALSNCFSVTHTPIERGISFYKHITAMESLIETSGWIMETNLLNGDTETVFQQQCKHDCHEVTVLVHESNMQIPSKMIQVRCTEPQTIYDLMMKYDLRCSTVWNSQISLSARAPCLALVEHKMKIIKINTIPCTDDIGETPKNLFFYHNMKHIKMRTRYNVLRHVPYTLPTPKNSDVVLPGDRIPVAVYYHNPMEKLGDVLKKDGRFISPLRFAENLDSVNRDPEDVIDDAIDQRSMLECRDLEVTIIGDENLTQVDNYIERNP